MAAGRSRGRAAGSTASMVNLSAKVRFNALLTPPVPVYICEQLKKSFATTFKKSFPKRFTKSRLADLHSAV